MASQHGSEHWKAFWMFRGRTVADTLFRHSCTLVTCTKQNASSDQLLNNDAIPTSEARVSVRSTRKWFIFITKKIYGIKVSKKCLILFCKKASLISTRKLEQCRNPWWGWERTSLARFRVSGLLVSNSQLSSDLSSGFPAYTLQTAAQHLNKAPNRQDL